MGKIHILDDITSGQIAAGEVVQRPVSVVKELVENSLDAGADRIAVEIEGGGKDKILVLDNGSGMSGEDVQYAFYRHATSKIRSAGDLYNLNTLGFRGEALPSIGAVSDLTLKTREHSASEGHKVQVKGGEIISIEPVGCPTGTSVHLSDLFYNTPARRKHLKSKGTEAGLVAGMVQCMAVARPGVQFSLKSNNRVVFRAGGSGRLLDVVSSIYGVDAAGDMIEIESSAEGINLRGLAGKPSFSRRARSHMYLVVNGRYVRNRNIYQAIDDAYSGMITSGRHPVAVLWIEVDARELDVNIHPAKMEIRMEKENEIASLVKETIRKNLRTSFLIQGYTPRKEVSGSTEAFTAKEDEKYESAKPGTGNEAYAFMKKDRQPYKQEVLDFSENAETTEKKIGKQQGDFFYKNIAEKSFAYDESLQDKEEEREKKVIRQKETDFPFLQVLGQLMPTYILAAGPDGLYIIDQHAAHERILYEEILAGARSERPRVQMLLTPVPLELNLSSQVILEENAGQLRNIGFIFDEFGENTYLLRGMPEHLSNREGAYQFIDILEEMAELGKEARDDFRHALLTRLSCRNAVKSGEKLSHEEMHNIIKQLSGTEEPYTCPHGRPVLAKITEQELLRMFSRPG